MSGWLRSWGISLRLARREARRHRGRSALIMVLIGAPVLALAFVAVSYDTFTLTREEAAARQWGTADAVMRWDSDGARFADKPGSQKAPPRVTDADVTALFPAGSKAVRVELGGSVRVHTATGLGVIAGYYLPMNDPITAGMVTVLRGVAPVTADEVALNEEAAQRLGVSLGGTVRTVEPERSYRVTAIAEMPDDLSAALLFPPSALAPERPGGSWLVQMPGDPTADDIAHLAAKGVTVNLRSSLSTDAQPVNKRRTFTTSVMVTGLIVFEVILLCGPAFAVGARRRQRDLALVAANGGMAAQLRRIVLADGLVLGLLGSVAGVALGPVVAVVVRPLIETMLVHRRSGDLRFFPAALAAGVVLAVVTGVLAALAPAIAASRRSVVAALAGRRGVVRSRKRWVLAGLILLGGAAAVAIAGAVQISSFLVLTGLVLGQLALVILTPAMVGLLGRWGRILALTPRMALRNTARNRSSAAPAISAVMAVVAGSVMIGIYWTSGDARNAERFQPGLPMGYVSIPLSPYAVPMPDATLTVLRAKVRETLPVDHFFTVDSVSCTTKVITSGADRPECGISLVLPERNRCPWPPEAPPPAEQWTQAHADPRCQLFAIVSMSDTTVDDGANLAGLTGSDPADLERALAVLRGGGAVVGDPKMVHDGKVTVEVADGTKPTREGVQTPTVELPGYALTSGARGQQLILSPGTVTKLGLSSTPEELIVATRRMPTTAEQDRLQEVMQVYGDGTWAYVETGMDNPGTDLSMIILAAASALVTLAAAAVVTGLAAADGRADLSTLGAVGASPRVRRLMALSQSGVIAGLGTLLGIGTGVGGAFALIAAMNRADELNSWPPQPLLPMAVPWAQLGIAVVVPVVAMLGAGLFTRSRLPIERRG